MAFKTFIVLASFLFATTVNGQGGGGGQQAGGIISSIPGASTATQIMASSVDGMSRYFAPDGPIQPAITAIGGLPMRGGEYLNRGITSISSGLNSGAQSLSRSAGNNGNVHMPGMESLRSMMPDQISSLGQMMRSGIQTKNGFIRGQAESGVQAGERLRSMMQNGLQTRRKRDAPAGEPISSAMNTFSDAASRVSNGANSAFSEGGSSSISNGASSSGQNFMSNMGESNVDPLMGESTMMHGSGGGAGMQMMDHMQNTMMKGKEQIKSQFQEHMNGHMSRMESMSGMGDNLRNQAQGISRALTSGLQGTMEHLMRTGEQVTQQLQGGMKQNMGSMSGLMGSMNKSFGNMGSHMQNNAEGLMKTAQSGIQQVTSSLQQAVSGPLSMLQNLSSSLTNMMQGKMMGSMGGGSSGGRY